MRCLGFIILRHVNSTTTNTYWIRCYESIRKFYPENEILIIDDNSDSAFLTNEDLYKTTIINSEFPKRGELLPYYYYLHNNLFDSAVILHDSVFIQQYINFEVDNYKILWTFGHGFPETEIDLKLLNIFNDSELVNFYKNQASWKGCFGAMVIITHDYLSHINSKYDISKLLDVILTRYDRSRFERIIACLLQIEYKTESLLGDIHDYCTWGLTIDDADSYSHLPLLKVWPGR
jgi:hypothetical protein